MPIPNTKAPISSDGPSGAIAPPKFFMSAAVGTTTKAVIAITISPPSRPPASLAYGHIPGALNIDSAEFYDPATNRLKPKAELAAIASHVPEGAVVSYCNTGHWAATDWFVMHELLGRTNAKLYAGSMVEWTTNASRPIESARTKWDDLKKKLGLGS